MIVNVIDGQSYEDASLMPDYGNWTCTKAQGMQAYILAKNYGKGRFPRKPSFSYV